MLPDHSLNRERVGYSSYSVVNAQYGHLARQLGEQPDSKPKPERLGTLVRFEKRQDEWHWVTGAAVAEALERPGWVDGAAVLLPLEIAATTGPLVEAAVCRVSAYLHPVNQPGCRTKTSPAVGAFHAPFSTPKSTPSPRQVAPDCVRCGCASPVAVAPMRALG